MKKSHWFLLVLMSISILGCAKPRIVSNPEAPYDSLGSLELKTPTEYTLIKYLTLGIVRKKSYSAMTHKLDRALEKEARSRYGADAVANVTYWPEPNSHTDVDYFYARGEMIRYKKF